MAKGAHIEIVKKDGKKILEHGWDESEIYKIVGDLCLTKPSDGGSTMRPHSYDWTVWNLADKEEIAQFPKRQDAIKYFEFLLTAK